VTRLQSLFPEMLYVREIGLKQASDKDIWNWARDQRCILITTDGDFLAFIERYGLPPQLIHIRECDFPLDVIEDLLRRDAVRIAKFGQKPDARLLLITKP
jgi:predicted nuclease of predicted toxin-antitoxin system